MMQLFWKMSLSICYDSFLVVLNQNDATNHLIDFEAREERGWGL
jgi:hypothetical protein